jgi:O-antigen/teichoic acid export membrane protein
MTDLGGPQEGDTLWRGRVPLRAGRSIREHAARGSIVNGSFLVGINLLALVRGFLVAGFLTTTDYGIWGILVVALGTLVWLKQVGISDKYIQQDEDNQEAAFQKAFTFELIFTTGFVAFLAAMVPLVALVYGRSELILPGFAVVLVLIPGIFTAPLWVYYRRMEFVKQRLLQVADPVIGTVVAVALAIAGAGYWALIGGALAGAYSAALVAVVAAPYRLRLRYDGGTLREYFRFSWPLFFDQFASVLMAQTLVLLGNWELGLAAVGAISLGSIISQYTHRIDEAVTGTLYPAICAVKDRTDLLFETFVKSNRLTLMWGVPFGVGIALFASDLVHFGLGEEWIPAIGVIQAFGLMAAADHVGFNWHAFFRARGTTKPMAVVSAVMLISVFAAAVPLTIAYGLDGWIAGVAIMTGVSLIARSWYLSRLFDGFAMLKHAARGIAPTVPAVAAVAAVRLLESADRSLPLGLAELALYVAVTLLATLLLERPLLRETLGYLRRAPVAGQPRIAA